MSNLVFSPLELPNGKLLSNRLAKAAMDEGMADANALPGQDMHRLYEAWADGGTGLLITGNVMIDQGAMTGPGGVVLESSTPLEPFRQWAKAGTKNGTQLWMQINHPGRQVYAALDGKTLSPSDVAIDLGKHSKLFSRPVPMSEHEIQDVIQRFVASAKNEEKAGFTGVQIHAAHGYLLSQFLSPLINKRTDKWGGSLENRARLLTETVKAIRKSLNKGTAVSVKLNSADFQRGGFDTNDAIEVVRLLNELGVDLVELSGGSYESPAMQGRTADGRTLDREAYFLEFAKVVAKVATMPVMTTGGIRRLAVAERVLGEGVDVVGIGTALAFYPALPKMWHQDPKANADIPPVNWNDKTLASLASLAMVARQFHRMGKGKLPKKNVSPLVTLITSQIRQKRLTKRYRLKQAN